MVKVCKKIQKPIVINRNLSCFRIHSIIPPSQKILKTLFEAYEVSQNILTTKNGIS